MTRKEFLKRLARKVSREHDVFEIDTRGRLRCGSMCPLTYLYDLHADEVCEVSLSLDISATLHNHIMTTSDFEKRNKDYSTQLRVDLLTAVGFI